jgi:hypothetical protein
MKQHTDTVVATTQHNVAAFPRIIQEPKKQYLFYDVFVSLSLPWLVFLNTLYYKLLFLFTPCLEICIDYFHFYLVFSHSIKDIAQLHRVNDSSTSPTRILSHKHRSQSRLPTFARFLPNDNSNAMRAFLTIGALSREA